MPKTTKTKTSPERVRAEKDFFTPGVGQFTRGELYEVAPTESARYGQVPERMLREALADGRFSEVPEAPASNPDSEE